MQMKTTTIAAEGAALPAPAECRCALPGKTVPAPMSQSNMNARALNRKHQNKRINQAHRRRGKRAYLKRFAYSPQREAKKAQSAAEAARRVQIALEAYCARARSVNTQKEIRALCSEVWQLRHTNSAYLGHVQRILNARRASGELPLY